MLLVASANSVYAGNVEPVPASPVIVAPVVVAYPSAPFWEGPYIGAQIGYATGDFEFNTDIFDNDNTIGGITTGYLWAVGNGWYLGPEFQYDWTDISITDAATGDQASFDQIARLKMIAGYEVGQGLLYGSAGIAYGNLDSVGAVFDGFKGSDTSYVIGLGYDYRVGDNWTVGGEYMYHDFRNIGSNGGDVSVDTLQLKASYRF